MSFQGAPIEFGMITFEPVGNGSGAGAKIVGGRYDLVAEPGEYQVKIEALRQVGTVESLNQADVQQYLPAQYNESTELSAVVEPTGSMDLPFEL
ncbi:MAG: hypothetical protein AAGB00_01655 [Planctomycetota bacterium]